MKKIFTTSLFIFVCFGFCKAQYVTIPDTSFVKFLQLTYPSCMNGNQMDTTCSDIVNESSVYCSHGMIADLTGIQYFKNVTYIDCSSNLLTALPPLPATLNHLTCYGNYLTAVDNLPTTLGSLDCNGNLITALPNPLPASLTYIDCSFNALTALPTLPDSLISIDCSFNNLAVLPNLPASLQYLTCTQMALSALPALPANLLGLECDYNNLTVIPALPATLKNLECPGNNLTVIPALPATLTSFDCAANRLTALPALPNGLIRLDCDENYSLAALPALPPLLTDLVCFSCNLTSLPTLPATLTSLSCSQNQLTVLPALPASVNYLICSGNKLTALPDLAAVMNMLLISSNPAITCLPPIKKFTGASSEFNIAGTGITCLPNVIAHIGSNPAIDTMPICDIFNPNGCAVAWNIKGQVVKDGDGSCATANDGAPVQNISMKLYDSGNNLLQQVYSNVTGDFSFNTSLGTYNTVIDTAGLPFTVLCPSTNIHTDTLTTADSLDYNANFRLYCKPGYDLGVNAITSTNSFFPNHSVAINISAGDEAGYYGVPCNTAGLGGTVTTTISGPVTITSASSNSNAVSTVSGNTITWNVTDFSLVDFNNTFSFILHTNTSAGIGQQVCVSIMINAPGTDNNTANNSLNQCFTVLNSYDPNDKEVSPAGAIVPGYDGYLTYTIHFQNTGTAPAENIQVIDTISHNLDISTFQLVAFSNQNITQVFDRNRVVKFSFPNINLPDSTANEPASHGYVQYKIKPLSNLTAGDSINNTAYIYFDFNSPIVTNTTSNTIEVATGLKNISSPASFTIYPNPVSQQLTVSSNLLLGSEISITDLLGRTILTQTTPSQTNQTTIDVSSLTPGVYFITLHSVNGNVVRKFVKE